MLCAILQNRIEIIGIERNNVNIQIGKNACQPKKENDNRVICFSEKRA